MTNAGAEEAKPVVHRTHHEYTFLTKETAATHTLDECVKHFHSTEQGVKSALTRKGISETKDMVHDEKHGWKPKAAE